MNQKNWKLNLDLKPESKRQLIEEPEDISRLFVVAILGIGIFMLIMQLIQVYKQSE